METAGLFVGAVLGSAWAGWRARYLFETNRRRSRLARYVGPADAERLRDEAVGG